MATPAIEVAGLRRSLGAREVLRDVSFELGRGETLVVFGPNGAGKTTLLRVLATLLRPGAGSVRVLGHELPGDGWQLRSQVGFIGHSPLLYSDLDLRDNLRYYARLYRVDAARIDAVIEATGMSGRADDPVHTYSRGMLQRAAACRALLHDPPLLLLDEPRANLDPGATAALESLLAGRTRVVTSHDPSGGLREADRVLGLRDGAVELSCLAGEATPELVGALYR